MKDYSGPKTLRGLFKVLISTFDQKQDNIRGVPGQMVGFGSDGKPIPQQIPDTGVTTFKGRSGTVVPQTGDYTPEMIGADPAGSAAAVQQQVTNLMNTQISTMATQIQDNINPHLNNTSNPHSVTKAQVGLGNVPNVATNDQTPTYTQPTTLATLVSGEKLSVSMGKIMKAINDLITHLGNKSNPHAVTAAQAGAVPTTRKVNGKALSSDITLSAADVAAVPTTGGTMTGPLTIGKMKMTWNSTEGSLDFEVIS